MATRATSRRAELAAQMFLCQQLQLKEWLEAMLLRTDIGEDLSESLKDGVILCQLVNSIVPDSIKDIRDGLGAPLENISNFLSACKSAGVADTVLFAVVDLTEKRNIQQVIRCLMQYAACARTQHPEVPKVPAPTKTNFPPDQMKATIALLNLDSADAAATAGPPTGAPPPSPAAGMKPTARAPPPLPSIPPPPTSVSSRPLISPRPTGAPPPPPVPTMLPPPAPTTTVPPPPSTATQIKEVPFRPHLPPPPPSAAPLVSPRQQQPKQEQQTEATEIEVPAPVTPNGASDDLTTPATVATVAIPVPLVAAEPAHSEQLVVEPVDVVPEPTAATSATTDESVLTEPAVSVTTTVSEPIVAVTEPAIVQPVITTTALTQPAVTEPAVTEPAVTEPAVTEPAVTEPAVTEPAVIEPAVSEPTVTEPAVIEPAVSEPAVSEPAVTEPAVTEATITEPAVTEPAVTEPAVTEPAPAVSEPAVSEPAVSEPAVSEPAVTELAVTEPATTESAVSEPAIAEAALTEPAVIENVVTAHDVAEATQSAISDDDSTSNSTVSSDSEDVSAAEVAPVTATAQEIAVTSEPVETAATNTVSHYGAAEEAAMEVPSATETAIDETANVNSVPDTTTTESAAIDIVPSATQSAAAEPSATKTQAATATTAEAEVATTNTATSDTTTTTDAATTDVATATSFIVSAPATPPSLPKPDTFSGIVPALPISSDTAPIATAVPVLPVKRGHRRTPSQIDFDQPTPSFTMSSGHSQRSGGSLRSDGSGPTVQISAPSPPQAEPRPRRLQSVQPPISQQPVDSTQPVLSMRSTSLAHNPAPVPPPAQPTLGTFVIPRHAMPRIRPFQYVAPPTLPDLPSRRAPVPVVAQHAATMQSGEALRGRSKTFVQVDADEQPTFASKVEPPKGASLQQRAAFDLNTKMNDLRGWIERVSGARLAPAHTLLHILRDGVILVQLLQSLFPDRIAPPAQRSCDPYSSMRNIGWFLKQCGELGVQRLFAVTDLTEMHDMLNVVDVVECLWQFAARCEHAGKTQFATEQSVY